MSPVLEKLVSGEGGIHLLVGLGSNLLFQIYPF